MLPDWRYGTTEPTLIATTKTPLTRKAMMNPTIEVVASNAIAKAYGTAHGCFY